MTDAKGKTPEERERELLDHFSSMPRKDARHEIAILPYYHQLENEITKPNQGTFVTRYFQTKWRASLGSEASNIVLALRLLADRDGTTFASQQTIAKYAGLSLRAVQRWLADNEKAVADRSEQWRAQWQFLHTYFLKSKSPRYLIRREGTVSRAKRTTSLYQVAMDDPVHPDDEGTLFTKAAERIVRQEYAKEPENNDLPYNRPTGGNRKKQIIFEGESAENSPYNRPTGGLKAPPNGLDLPLSYRSNGLSNVRETSKADGSSARAFADDPRVANLGSRDRVERESMADLIDEVLKKLERNPTAELHRSAGFHRRVAMLMDPPLVHEALTATQDAVQRQRAGDLSIRKGPAAYFGGIVQRIAEREGIDLGVEWRTKRPSTGQNEPSETSP